MFSFLRRIRRSAHIHEDVVARFRRHLDDGGRILDIPCGRGIDARNLQGGGFSVWGGDLGPHARGQGFPRVELDLRDPLPFETATFDGVLHAEGIEHLDAQVAALSEMARVLRPGGVLIVTTPNLLHLEGRLATMLTGHAYRKRAVVAETATCWARSAFESTGRSGAYFGHVFLINAFQLRVYLIHAGLEIVEIDTTKYSLKSVLLAPLLYIPVWFSTRRLLAHRRSGVPRELQRAVRRQILSPAVLFGRKLIISARKPLVAGGALASVGSGSR